jgi:hypothetical protein
MAERMTLDELQRALPEAWHRMHHNASLLHYLPPFRNAYEEDLFWRVLNDILPEWLRNIEEGIAQRFGEHLKLYSYGRSGATIAPHEWMCPAPMSNFGGLNWGAIYDGPRGLDAYNCYRRALAVIRYINEAVHDLCTDIPHWWADMVKANEWGDQIAAHDGMILVTREVWVPDVPAERRKA